MMVGDAVADLVGPSRAIQANLVNQVSMGPRADGQELKPQIPWLRVFVEGVVMVGSILLAFGIQART